MATTGPQVVSPSDPQQLAIGPTGEPTSTYGPITQVGVSNMDSQLTPRQVGADELVTRERFAGREANSPTQTS